MTMTRRTLTFVATALLVAGCGGAKTAHLSVTARQATPAGCAPLAGQTDLGAHDTDPPLPGGEGSTAVVDGAGFPSSTAETLGWYDEIAVVQVMSRAAPIAAAGNNGPAALPSVRHMPIDPADPSRTGWQVLRAARFAVFRQLKGQIPSCLDLDVPGGTAGKYQDLADLVDSQFPARFGPGDTMLGLFSTHDNPRPGIAVPAAAYAQTLLKANPDGSLTLPFGDRDHINVNTWIPPYSPPPASDNPPPYPPPGGTPPMPGATSTTTTYFCWAPGQPPPSPTDPPPCGRGLKH